MAINLKVNGMSRSVPAEPDAPLLYVLRNDLELNGVSGSAGTEQLTPLTLRLMAMRGVSHGPPT